MNDATPVPPPTRSGGRKRQSRALPESAREACAVCGGKLRIDNIVGVCRRTPECRRERKARLRRQAARERQPRVPAEHPRRVSAIPAGTVFGRLVTLEESPKGGRAKVLCRCECGVERHVFVTNLKRGITLSCGCLRRENAGRPKGPGGIYLPAGSTSGRLTTLEDAVKSRDDVRVRCECGAETAKNAQRLKLGKVESCGCLAPSRTHGLSGHSHYRIWYGIVKRTSNPDDPNWDNYGGRGITLCERWRGLPDGLLNFAADMGPRPVGYSAERLDNDGGYWCGRCPDCVANGRPANVEWRTWEDQANNRRTVQKVTRERDALAAEVERLRKLLGSQGLPLCLPVSNLEWRSREQPGTESSRRYSRCY